MAYDFASISTTAPSVSNYWMISGTKGTGKTSLAAEFPNPIFLFTEESRGQLKVPSFNGGEPAQTPLDVFQAVDSLIAMPEIPFSTFVLDSADQMEVLIFSHLAQTSGVESIELIDYGKGYHLAWVNWWQPLINRLAILKARGINIVLTCHVESKKMVLPGQPEFDQWDLAMHKRAGGNLSFYMDAMIFLRREMFVTEEKGAFNKKRGVARDTDRRLMCATESAQWKCAANRLGLPPEMEFVPGNGYNTLRHYIDNPIAEQPVVAETTPPTVAA